MTQTVNQLAASVCGIVRSLYGDGSVTLHRPVFAGNEKQYLADCIDSNFVSSVGAKVTEFEQQCAAFTGTKFAIATVNGTAALHIALQLAGVARGDEVITQALSFIATCNAVTYAGATPVFVDVDEDTMGLSPAALSGFLTAHAKKTADGCFNRKTGKRLAACVPMHTFGFPCRIAEIKAVCAEWGVPLIEDAAESLGSYVGRAHTGTFGLLATLSFNGNKVITTGGGGMILTNDAAIAKRAKHLTTTAKVPHPYEFVHDEVGYNYRLPNLNAALGCAQMEQLPGFLTVKRDIAARYHAFFAAHGVRTVSEREGTRANYWLNAIVLNSLSERDDFLRETNAAGVMTRPTWRLMSDLDLFRDCQNDGLPVSQWLAQRVVNVPSSVPQKT